MIITLFILAILALAAAIITMVAVSHLAQTLNKTWKDLLSVMDLGDQFMNLTDEERAALEHLNEPGAFKDMLEKLQVIEAEREN